ncbi:histidine kinase [Wenjunlia vitaminophila]|uniref:Histidine kinase n=1 Tax=Wenjunlia vitaminophila TaxID=76728 RepID=A0A0T6LL85_WENVI|nr:PspC domain-containing protein [Wenjunlia vitaminophila]KRV46859.1 histidine kinase [Wenjunlia vitaminophila]
MPTSPPPADSAVPPWSSAAQSGPKESPPRKLYRSAEGRICGGVARGLAGHLGLPVLWVRLAFLVLMFPRGMGVLLYAVFWFVVPLGVGGVQPQDATDKRHRRRLDGRNERMGVVAALTLVVAFGVLAGNLEFGLFSPYVWPFALVGTGVVLVWRQADDTRRARWVRMGRSNKRLLPVARSAAGVVLVGFGVAGFIVIQGSVEHLGAVFQAVVAVLAGIALIAGPYLVRMAQDLSSERLMRIRAQERAEVAAHVHDSVLHTLTLIQRHAEDPREVARLARAQERELRRWLYQPDADREDEPSTLAEAVRRVAGEVEDAHGVPVEVVCVGDCPLDERLAAQLQAAREAMVNAAKYGGGAPVQVYAEVEEATVLVFVRDRGPGFDPEQVPADRMGVRESIIGRMRRNGGRAVLRGVPGGGTEVELEMERVRS